MKLNGLGMAEMRKAKFMAADKTYEAIFWSILSVKDKNIW